MLMFCVCATILALVIPWCIPSYGGLYAGLDNFIYAAVGAIIIVIVWVSFAVWKFVL